MAIITNQATLMYNGNTVNSNITTGEVVDVLSATKTAVGDSYTIGSEVTYVISIMNTGTTPYTGLTITDDLGAYSFGAGTVYPLEYIAGSINYYIDGVLQPTPTITNTSPLSISGINVPANGNATIIYKTSITSFAPLDIGSDIINTATITEVVPARTTITVTETISVADIANLSISKCMNPSTVSESGQVTYTFTVENTGNIAITTSDNVEITDTFEPKLDPITVTFNDIPWQNGVNYLYSGTTGVFNTLEAQITVPAATYTQNATTGEWQITPGISTLVITGTIVTSGLSF